MRYNYLKSSYEIFLFEQFSEMAIKTDKKFIRDDNDFRFQFYRSLSPKFKTAFFLNSLSFADEKLSGLSKASSNEILLGLKFHPVSKLAFSILGGYKFDYQMGQRDNGWVYRISSDTTELNISDYHLRANLNHGEDFITPRKNISSALNLTLWRRFAPEVESKIGFTAKRIKRDFYFYADTNLQKMYGVNFNIEGRDEKSLSGIFILGYPLIENLMIDLNFAVDTRNIMKLIRYKTSSLYDSNIEEFNLNTGVAFAYESEKVRFKLGFNYAERNEIHTPKRNEFITESVFLRITQNEERKNNQSLRRSINGEFSVAMSERFFVGSMFYISLFKYDTPSILNDDDRDELLQILRIFFRFKLSDEIFVDLPVDLNNQHLVYIFSTRSVNNNWNRIIKLSPSIAFERGRIRNYANFSVLANYTVYDFEAQVSSVKSYVFRQFYLNDSLFFPVFDRISFEGNLQLIFSESGRLKWKEFKERPTLFINTSEYNFRFVYSVSDDVKFSTGYRMFDERRFKFVGLDKVPDSRITARGLTCGVEIGNEKFKFNLNGWIERLKFGERISDVPNLNLSLIFNL